MTTINHLPVPTKIFKLLIKNSFSAFLYKAFRTVNPGTEFNYDWYMDLLASYLMEIEKGNIKRLIINLPPRTLKSMIISVAWPAWVLGHNPAARIMVASYTQALSIKHSLDSRLIVEADWYRQLFPGTVLSKKHNQKSKFLTTAQGFRLATSVGGTATGEGGDLLIIDDPHNPTYINSVRAREKVINWYEQTFATRLNNHNKGAIICVMQRLHCEDLCNYLENNGGWTVLKLPAIADRSYQFNIDSASYDYPEQSVLCPIRQPSQILERIAREIGPVNFAAQYMQSPLKQAGIIRPEQIKYYDELPGIDFIVQSWDTAIKVSDQADYSVCSIWGVSGQNFFLLDLRRGRFDYPQLKEKAISLIKKWRPKAVIIEDQSSGQALIQDLKLAKIQNIIPFKSRIDKVTRFASVTDLLPNVMLPKVAPWLAAAIRELTEFPYGKHDDIVDSISQFLQYIKSGPQLLTDFNIRSL